MQLVSVGVIPDGNRRYAKRNNLNYEEAYRLGFEKAKELMGWAFKREEIKNLTFYALSLENLNKRVDFEKNIIFSFFHKFLDDSAAIADIRKKGVKLNFLGRLNLLPKDLHEKMLKVMAGNEKGDREINFLIAYTGSAEIVDAAKKAVEDGEINEESIEKNLYTRKPVDLVIRTGNVSRLSGFLTWQTAYSELYFLEKLWPEMNEKDFELAVEWYYNTERRFGK